MNSVSTLGMAYRTRAMVTHAQSEIAKMSGEIGSGFKSDVAASVGVRLGENISTRNLYDQISGMDSGITLIGMRLDTMSLAFDEVEKTASNFFGMLATMRGDSHIAPVIKQEAVATIERMVQALNVSVGDRYLFSGVNVSSPPLQAPGQANPATGVSPLEAMDALQAANPATDAASAANLVALIGAAFNDGAAPAGTGFEETFYNGTPRFDGMGDPNARVSGRIAQDRVIDYGVQANDQSFRDILQGLYMIASMDMDMPEDAREVYVSAAYDLIGKGLTAEREAHAVLAGQQNDLDVQKDLNANALKIMNERLVGFETVDLVESNARMTIMETQLQASIVLTNKMASLSVAAIMLR